MIWKRYSQALIRLIQSATDRRGGLGFGLPIARAIVEQMGGVITVTSEHGVEVNLKW